MADMDFTRKFNLGDQRFAGRVLSAGCRIDVEIQSRLGCNYTQVLHGFFGIQRAAFDAKFPAVPAERDKRPEVGEMG